MDRLYAQQYAVLYQQHWWWRAREYFLIRVLRSIAPPSGFGHILDVGCGDGLFFDVLREFGTPEGVEVSSEIVTRNDPATGTIHLGHFGPGFQPEREYGLILMLDVLEHLEDPEQALRHARALLRPGGRVVLTVPAFKALWTAHDDYNHHLTRYRIPTIKRLAQGTGFEVSTVKYFFHTLFFAKLLARAIEVLIPNREKMSSIPPRAINRLATNFCLFEQRVVRAFAPPFGSSLFALLDPIETGTPDGPALGENPSDSH